MSLTSDELVCIEVIDKGYGFNLEQLQPNGDHIAGFGLFSIRERLEQMGGRLEVHTVRGEGTRVLIFAPYRKQQITGGDGKCRPKNAGWNCQESRYEAMRCNADREGSAFYWPTITLFCAKDWWAF